jgi:hypothetical protein
MMMMMMMMMIDHDNDDDDGGGGFGDGGDDVTADHDTNGPDGLRQMVTSAVLETAELAAIGGRGAGAVHARGAHFITDFSTDYGDKW